MTTNRLSPAGVNCLKHVEGFRSRIYKDADGWAIGFGCRVDYATWCDREIDESQAESLMRIRLRECERVINEAVKMPLKQCQFDACCLLAYNIGVYAFQRSTLVKLLNQGKIQEAAEQFPRWVYSVDKTKPNEGLVARRALERRIFLGESVPHYIEIERGGVPS